MMACMTASRKITKVIRPRKARSQIDPSLQQEDMVDLVRIAFTLPVVDRLILVAEIHIEPRGTGLVDPNKESVLVESGTGSFAAVM